MIRARLQKNTSGLIERGSSSQSVGEGADAKTGYVAYLKDKELVVMHDCTLERITNAEEPFPNCCPWTNARLRFGKYQGARCRLPVYQDQSLRGDCCKPCLSGGLGELSL